MLYLVALLFISNVFAASVPQVKKCKSADSKCLKSSTQELIPSLAAGLPSIGVSQLDPLFIKRIDASTPNLKLILTDLNVTGLKNCVAKKVQRDGTKTSLKMVCSVDVDGHYDMKGRLLIIPIEGNGKCHVSLKKATFTVDSEIGEEVGADGKKHWIVKKWSQHFELKEKSDLQFENLFNGNKVLSEAAQTVIESSSNDIILDVGTPIVNEIISKIIDSVAQFYKAYPIEDLELQ